MALQAKAKGAPSYRFYLLYDALYRKDVLKYAYCQRRRNFGPAGGDILGHLRPRQSVSESLLLGFTSGVSDKAS